MSLVISPSKLPQLFLCNASLQRQDGLPGEDSAAAQRGRDLHDAVATMFRFGKELGTKAIEKDDTISEADKKLVYDCFEVGLSLAPAGIERSIIVEETLAMKYMGLRAGTPDWIARATANDGSIQAVITDWKFGTWPVGDPADNKQLWPYLIAYMKKKRDAGFKMDSIEGVIYQPSSFRVSERQRQHTFTYDELKGRFEEIKNVVEKAKAPNPTVTPGKDQCKFCLAKPNCPEYQAWEKGEAEVKDQAHKAELATVTEGTPIYVQADNLPAMPVVILSAEVVAKAKEQRDLAMTLTVVDDGTLASAGMLRKAISEYLNLIEENRKIAGDPFFRFKQKVDTAAKEATAPLKQALDHLTAQASAYYAAKDKAKRDEEEKVRKAAEAEAQAKADTERKAREEQEAKARAKAAEEQAAAMKEGKAKRDAEAAAAKQREEAEKAERDRKEAEQREAESAAAAAEEKRKQDEAAATPAAKVAGFRQGVDYEYIIPDFTKVPATRINDVLMTNEKVLKALHKAKVLTPENSSDWLIIKEIVGAKGSK